MKNTALKLSLIAFLMALPLTTPKAANAQDRDYQKRESAVKENMTFARRLEDIAGPIRVKLAKDCGDMVAPFIGAQFATTDSVGETYQQVMKTLYNTTLHPTITMIAAQSPAAKGLQLGDVITHVNGVALSEGRDSLDEINGDIRNSQNTALKLSIKRDGKAQVITVKPVTACDKPIRLVSRNASDIFVDDTKIGVTKGMLKSSASDEDIARKIEKELRASFN